MNKGIRYKKYYLVILLNLFFSIYSIAQIDTLTIQQKISGTLLDAETKEPLAYANVLLMHKNKGGITNEQGYFSVTVDAISLEDTLSFHYVGYQSKKIALSDLEKNPILYLRAETFSLNETFVFANDHNATEIMSKVIPNKGVNYKNSFTKNRIFTRERFVSDINQIEIKFKKSSFEELNEKMTKLLERKLPKHSVSYTDLLGDVYLSSNKNDTLKLAPVKIVSLKDKNLTDITQLEKMFEKIFSNTEEKEYWKIKSGIIGGKVDLGEEESAEKRDSITKYYKDKKPLYYYAKRLDRRFDNLLEDKKKWEFLYHTNRYDYTLIAGTKINGEDVYIIDFVPKSNGNFIGRAYVSMSTYALIKAEYSYAEGKHGTNVHLFGVGYTENEYSVSVYFEKINGFYQLKYYSKKEGNSVSFDRNISLIKKKKRFLVDKKINEIKVRLKLKSSEESSVEILVLSTKNITKQHFLKIKQKPSFKYIYVDQFSDDLWKGYSIIEPTKQMREYKKDNK